MKRKILLWLLLLPAFCTGSFATAALPPDTLRTARLRELLERGDAYEKQYDTYRALLCYEEALQLDSTPDVVRKLAQCHYKRGHYRSCIRTLEKLDSDSMGHQDMRLKYHSYSNLDKKRQALYWGARIADEYPYDGDVVAKMAHHYNTAEQPDSALYYTRRYMKNDSVNLFVNRQQAFAFFQKGKYADALGEYDRLLALGDSTATVFYYMGLCHAKQDSVSQAYDFLYESARLNDFNQPQVLSQLGMVCVELGMSGEGIDYLEKAISLLQPDDKLMFTLKNSLADGYFRRLKYTDCVHALKECLNYNPDAIYTLFKLAQTYGLMNNTAQEEKYYQEFITKAGQKEDVKASLAALIEMARVRVKKIREERFFEGAGER